jgi:hypothetical protein
VLLLDFISFTIDFFWHIAVAAINNKQRLKTYFLTMAKLVFCWGFKLIILKDAAG